MAPRRAYGGRWWRQCRRARHRAHRRRAPSGRPRRPRRPRAGGGDLLRRERSRCRGHRGALRAAGRDRPRARPRRLAPNADAVLDLADEPVLPASAKLRLAALALSLGLRYEAPGALLEPRYEPVAFEGPKLAVIGTGKRTGKTAVAGHWATPSTGSAPTRSSSAWVGGPAEPQLAAADTDLEQLLRIADAGGHAASDFLEDAVVAGVRTVGCRRVGGACRRPRAVERAGRRRARRLARAGRDHVRGVGAWHPACGGRPHRVRARRGSPRAVRRVPAWRAPSSCWRHQGRRRPRPARSPSSCAPSRSSRSQAALGWRSSPPARRLLAGVDPRVSSTNLARRSAGGGPRAGRRGGL